MRKQGFICSQEKYDRVLREEIGRVGADYRKVLRGSKERPCIDARWATWGRLHGMGHSYYMISKVSGYDHTAIMHALNPDKAAARSDRDFLRRSGALEVFQAMAGCH